MLLEKTQLQVVQLSVNPVAQITDDTLAPPFQQVGVEEIKDPFDQEDRHQAQGQEIEQPGVALKKDLVQQRLDHVGLQGVEPAHHHHAAHGQQQLGVVRLEHR